MFISQYTFTLVTCKLYLGPDIQWKRYPNIQQYMYIDIDIVKILCQCIIFIRDHRSRRRPWWQHFIANVSSHGYSKLLQAPHDQKLQRNEKSGIQLRHDQYVEAYKGVKELLSVSANTYDSDARNQQRRHVIEAAKAAGVDIIGLLHIARQVCFFHCTSSGKA